MKISHRGAKLKSGCFVDPTHPLSRSLVGFWIFNEGGGSVVADYSGNGYFGVLTSMLAESDWVGSIHGGGLDFDGSGDMLVVGDKPKLNLTSGMAISAWINARTLGENNFGRILDKGNDTDPAYRFQVDASNALRFSTTIGGGVTSDTNVFVFNKWFHAVVSFNLSNAFFYVDGKLVGAPAYTSVPAASAVSFTIGNRAAGARAFNGVFDSVRVYSRFLTQADVVWLYSEPYADLMAFRWHRYFVSGGGTVFNKSVSGSGSFSGLLFRKALKNLASAESFSGVVSRKMLKQLLAQENLSGFIAKKTLRSLSGIENFSGSIFKKTLRNLLGEETFAGVLSARIVFVKGLTAALTFTGSLVRKALKVLSGVETFSGVLIRKSFKVLSSVLSFVGAPRRVFVMKKTLAGAVSFVGSLVRVFIRFKTVQGVITFLGNIAGVFQAGTGVVYRKLLDIFHVDRHREQ